MSSDAFQVIMCPICLETLKKPIKQCTNGHSMCGLCLDTGNIRKCPTCRGEITSIRNNTLEQLIEGMKDVQMPCYFRPKGCSYTLKPSERESHELECKFRTLECEGKKFAKWKCDWNGPLGNLHTHFKDYHNNHISMRYRTEASMPVSFERNFYDIQLISYNNGQHLFYYKHKVDVDKRKVYWLFQLIGRKVDAQHYYYEFEIHKGPIRKFKVTEICESDSVDAESIFQKENCVVINFENIKTFLNHEGELELKCRIMSIKKK